MVASTLAGQSPDSSRSAYRAEHLAMHERYRELRAPVSRVAMRQAGGSLVVPQWLADGSRFWYADTRFSGRTAVQNTIYLVDPAANTVRELFDTARLRGVIREALGVEPELEGVPFRQFEFVGPDERVVRFVLDEADGRTFELDLETYELRAHERMEEDPSSDYGRCDARGVTERSPSPNGQWIACVREYDVWLLGTSSDREAHITSGGTEEYAWRIAAPDGPSGDAWSPDGSHLALLREDRREMTKIPVVRWLTNPPEIEWIHDEPPARPRIELYLYDVASDRLTRLDLGEAPPWWIGTVGWRPDGSELLYQRATRAGLQEDILAVDPATGASRLLHSEAANAPVYADRQWYGGVDGSEVLVGDGQRLLFLSEQSGPLQLYLKELDGGGPAVQLTPGPHPVLRIVEVDEERGWIYYTAFGDPARPYDAHFYRVRLDGSGLAQLTEAGASYEPPGMAAYFSRFQMAIHLSPSMEYFIGHRSTPEQLPVIELRRTDGTLVNVLSRARLGPVAEELRWRPPEEFVVRAADGRTDLWGTLWKPYDFDPARRYPVIEVFYNERVPRTFTPTPEWAEQLAQLGFITVMLEGRGANWRGREFRDAFHGRPEAFIEDHVAALHHLAEERPYMDLSRVGAYGYSGGGDDALWAAVRAPDTYHAVVAVAPTESDSPEVNEALLSAVTALQGELLLIHGTADTAAPLPLTMRFIDACIRAGKSIDLLLLPDRGHGLGSAWDYHLDRARDFFLEHLDP